MLPAVMVGDRAGMVMTVCGGNAGCHSLSFLEASSNRFKAQLTFRGIVSVQSREGRNSLESVET